MLNYSADWYRGVLNAMHDLVLVKAPDSHLLWANTAFLDYYGMSEEQLFQLVDAKHSDPDDTLQYIKDDLTVVQSGKPLDIPSEAVTDASGDTRHFHSIKTPNLVDGNVAGVIAVSRSLDNGAIARRVVDHKDAKAFVAPIKSLTESFPNPMVMVDITGRVICTSPLWKKHFNDPFDGEMERFRDIYPELSALCDDIDNVLAQGASLEGLVEQTGSDGVHREFSTRAAPWRYKDGTIGGATVIATDVSMLFERTAELKQSNDELMQFAYRASHDLKGPLTTAKGLAEFIAEDIANGALDDATENSEKILSLMTTLESTVQSFLALARADISGNLNEAVHLKEVISDICIGLNHQMTSADIRVETDLKIETLFSQSTRLTQILDNLMSNAIKYHAPEQADRFVRIRSDYALDGTVQVFVEDNGSGIAPGNTDKVFDLFSRFHESNEGTGLGLAIVKKHVDALNGHIGVTSCEGVTAFCLTLPATAMEMAS